MNEIQTEWVNRLRSGEIKKNKDQLHGLDGSMCAIGVLCGVLYDAGLIEREEKGYGFEYDGDAFLPSGTIMKHAGVRMIPVLAHNEKNSTFTSVANYIEKELND